MIQKLRVLGVSIAFLLSILMINPLTMDITSLTVRYATGVTSTSDIPVQLSGEVRMSTSMTPQNILPGSNDVTLTIVNNGQASASNVRVTVTVPTSLNIIRILDFE